GITNVVSPTEFDPYGVCTRAQIVMFLNRVAGRPSPTIWNCPFTDVDPNENYYAPMLWALERGITNGTTATTFSPRQACTRAQMVMFLYRYLGGQ
ncbi:MAG: S-layer homology domain-containing protein, partial [Oscillibacter sp.]|nr:S-layer homology domain-containing protein [Oscillibacter sp.]